MAVATLTETYTKKMKVSQLTNKFRRDVAYLTGRVNSDSFKGWSAGEVMFCGCSFTAPEKGAEEVTVSFNFAIRPNEMVEVNGKYYEEKNGWDYLDIITEPDFDQDGKPTFKEIAINVLQIYPYAVFSRLQL
jgi:hypothetical protein